MSRTIFEPSKRLVTVCEAQCLLEPHPNIHIYMCSVALEDKQDLVSKRSCESWDVLGHSSFTRIQGYDGPAMDSKKQEQVDSTRFPGVEEGKMQHVFFTLLFLSESMEHGALQGSCSQQGSFPLPLSIQLVVPWLTEIKLLQCFTLYSQYFSGRICGF